MENLQGSGMIAGESSLAYDEIVTANLVTCRAIGIGAYLVSMELVLWTNLINFITRHPYLHNGLRVLLQTISLILCLSPPRSVLANGLFKWKLLTLS